MTVKSFVDHLKIPEELKKENKKTGGKLVKEVIQFLYGNGHKRLYKYMNFPEELDMFIFPAWLKHWVSPFKSDCEIGQCIRNVHDSKIIWIM